MGVIRNSIRTWIVGESVRNKLISLQKVRMIHGLSIVWSVTLIFYFYIQGTGSYLFVSSLINIEFITRLSSQVSSLRVRRNLSPRPF